MTLNNEIDIYDTYACKNLKTMRPQIKSYEGILRTFCSALIIVQFSVLY